MWRKYCLRLFGAKPMSSNGKKVLIFTGVEIFVRYIENAFKGHNLQGRIEIGVGEGFCAGLWPNHQEENFRFAHRRSMDDCLNSTMSLKMD